MNKEVFEAFINGSLAVPGRAIKFEQIEWSKHPIFDGVELKHIITGKDTEGQFSYHLVRIAPGKAKIPISPFSTISCFNTHAIYPSSNSDSILSSLILTP